MKKIFFDPVHKYGFYKIKNSYQKNFLSTTNIVSNQALSLPLFPTLTNEEKSFICDKISQFFEENSG